MAFIQRLTSSLKILSISSKTVVQTRVLTPSLTSQSRGVSDSSINRDFDTKSPYKDTKNYAPYRYGYEWKLFSGGLRPRVKKGRFKDKRPVGMPPVDIVARDRFRKDIALRGQNDYIDILGDGRIKPVDMYEGPEWLRGFKGREFERIVRQLEFARVYLKEIKPYEYHLMQKRLFFLFKKINKRKPSSFWQKNPEKYWHVLPGRFEGRFEKWNKTFD